MIAGCYTLDVYCDERFDEDNYCHNGLSRKQFTGRNKREVMKAAREKGWYIRGQKALCKRHNQQRKEA
jgi:hypothetical protein